MSDDAVSNEALRYEAQDAAALAPSFAPSFAARLWRRMLRAPAQRTDQEAETTANVGVAVRAMAIAFVVFALFGSGEMRHTARNLPGNAVSDLLVDAADRWDIMMQHLGPAHVEPIVRSAFDELRDKRWPWIAD
jgi:hypothetical protein